VTPGAASRSVGRRRESTEETGMSTGTNGQSTLRTPRVAIIGAGMSGIGMAAKLKAAGIESFHLYEMADDLGGTWRANTYPGLSCDVASRYYSYTFAPNPEWSSVYPAGDEIWAYLDRVAAELSLRDRISFGAEVDEAVWTGSAWRLRTKNGEEGEYDFIVSAAGGLVRTAKPDIPGLADFGGASFHSAEWDHSVKLDGQRVAVIGTGSTGVQITRALAGRVAKYELYQRTPQWILPLPNRRYTRVSRAIWRHVPGLQRASYKTWQLFMERTFGRATIQPGLQRRWISAGCRAHVRRVRDPELRARFTPADLPMCKRMIMATNFYPQFERPNVHLVDTPIDHVRERGIVTADGVLHELDVIVLATGFDAHAFLRPVELVGLDGVRLSEAWSDEPRAYKTVALPGFPNFLMLIGPHSPFGNQSLFTISETQADFAMQCIALWRQGRVDAMAPNQEATDRYNEALRAAMPSTIWTSGCKSWYIGKDGLPHAWPWTPERHREMLAAPDLSEWELQPGPAAEAVAGLGA
jgi:cation diffusion facilitator CzcD-associated flavoprotein CzcO